MPRSVAIRRMVPVYHGQSSPRVLALNPIRLITLVFGTQVTAVWTRPVGLDSPINVPLMTDWAPLGSYTRIPPANTCVISLLPQRGLRSELHVACGAGAVGP